jgi:hypothetical protein
MDTAAISQPTPTVAPQGLPPNLFELRNRRISVSFSATSITGDPLMHFKDRRHEVSVRGEEIRQVETEVGTLVTLTLEPDADAGALLFTLVIPRVVLATPNVTQPIATQGIYTRSRLPPRLPASVQLQTSEVVELKGTASFIVS